MDDSAGLAVAFDAVLAMYHSAGLGRAHLRRKLIARGVPVDDYLKQPDQYSTST